MAKSTNNNDLLIDANTEHQLSVIQVGERAARQSLVTLSKARDYIITELARVDSIGSRKQLRQLNRRIEKRLIQILSTYPELLEKEQRAFVKQEYAFQVATLSTAIVQATSIKTPKLKRAVDSAMNVPMMVGSRGAAVSLKSMLRSFPRDEAKRVVDRVTAGYFNGETTQQISRAISGTRTNSYRDGLLNLTRSNAFTMAKTGITHLQEQAKMQVYDANDDIIEGYRIVATLDSRTSKICRSLDGKTYPIKGNHPRPPFHYNCRSSTTPVLEETYRVDTGATRPSESGSVDADTTYYEWLKKRPAAFQDQALGKKQAMVFRNSGISAEEFRKASINQFNQPLSLDEMARKDKKIAEYLSNELTKE